MTDLIRSQFVKEILHYILLNVTILKGESRFIGDYSLGLLAQW
jgi:hypothetical protein